MKKLFKRTLSVILIAVMLIPFIPATGLTVSAKAYSGKCGDALTWELDEATGMLEISGTGDMYDYTNKELPEWAPYADSIEHVVVGDSVTGVGNYAFNGCSNLSYVDLGDSVARIGDLAFANSQVYSIYLPLSVKEIGEHPLSMMDTGMCTINYAGTKEQWDEITVRISDYYFYYFSIYCYADCIEYGKCGENAYWKYDWTTGLFEVYGSGDMYSYSYYWVDMPWWNFKDSIDKIVIGDSITDISHIAFMYCRGLGELVVGDSVKYIGSESFYGCRSLKKVTLPTSLEKIQVDAFAECWDIMYVYYGGTPKQWSEMVIDSGNQELTHADVHYSYLPVKGKCGDGLIWKYNYGACRLEIEGSGRMDDYDPEGGNPAPWEHLKPYMKTVCLDRGITYLGSGAFNNCDMLTEFKFIGTDEEWNTLEKGVNNDSITSDILKFEYFGGRCGDDLTWTVNKVTGELCISGTGDMYDYNSIDNIAPWREYYDIITDIVIGDSVTSIGADAFNNFGNIESIVIGDNVTEIGESAFQDCQSLESVTFGNSVERIGDSAFNWCTSLKVVDIPDSVVSIGDYAFAYCFALGHLKLGNGLKVIGAEAFESGFYFESVVIPDSVTEIGELAFLNCYALSQVSIPDSVASIGYSILGNTSYYKNEDNWTGDLLYAGNHLINSRNTISGEHDVREGTLTIADDLFFECSALTKLYIPRSVISIGDFTFDDCDIIIKCYNDSYAYNYAISKGIEYELACDHIFTDYIPDNNGTCVSDGTKTAYCDKGCGETDSITDKGSVTGIHQYGDWVVTVRATYVSEGEEIRYCLYCDATETQKTPVLTLKVTSDDFIMTVNCAEHIKDMRYAMGRYTTAAEIKKAEGNVALSNAIVQKYTKDGLFTYEMSEVGYYTLWVRMTDGNEYILGIDINIKPTVTSKGVTVTLHDLYNVKDFFIAKGEYQSYSEIKKNGYIFSAGAAKIGDRHEYTYTAYEPGVHTILVRYLNGTSVLLHETLNVIEPKLITDGLEVTVSNLAGVKVIRTAYGEWNTVRELKTADRVRNYTSKHDIEGRGSYTIQFPDEGPVTVIVEYNNGYKKVFHYDVKTTVTQS